MPEEEEVRLTTSSRHRHNGSHAKDKSVINTKDVATQPCDFTKARCTQDHLCNRIGVIATLGAIVMLLLFCSYYKSLNNDFAKPLLEVQEDISRDLFKLRAETKQEKAFWEEIQSGMGEVIQNATPSQPTLLLTAIPEGGEKAATCLVHHLSDTIKHGFQDSRPPVKHYTREYLSLDNVEHSMLLDKELRFVNSSHSVVVYNLEMMPASTAVTLHNFITNQRGPYKRVLVLVMLDLGIHYESISLEHLSLVVERRLHQLWKNNMVATDLPQVLSTFTERVALVKPESKYTTDKLCPL